MCRRIVKQFKAVEDFNSTAALDSDYATENTRSGGAGRGWVGRGGAFAVGDGGLRLGFDTCVVIGDVDDYEWVEFES